VRFAVRSTDQIFCIRQITNSVVLVRERTIPTLEKKWEHNETVHQLFIDFRKAYDSVRRELLCSILIEFCVPMKLVRLTKMFSFWGFSSR
jgi:hypothetical protein